MKKATSKNTEKKTNIPPLHTIKNKAERLMRLVDRSGCTFDFVLRNLDAFKDQFKAAKLKRSDLTPELISAARKLEHDETARLMRYNIPASQKNKTEETVAEQKPEPTKPELKEKTVPTKTEVPAATSVSVRKQDIFGFSVTAVIRWMGKNEWEFADAEPVMKHLGVNVSPSTIKIQLRAGKNGERGPAAKITKDQAAELTKIWENC